MPAAPKLSRVQVALIGAATVVVFDAVSATASRLVGFPYGRGVIGSFLIYAATGYFVAKAGLRHRLRAAALAGAILGLTDATLGWAVSWAIGPGRPATGLTPAMWLIVAALVMVGAAVLATVGGVAARWRRSGADTR